MDLPAEMWGTTENCAQVSCHKSAAGGLWGHAALSGLPQKRAPEHGGQGNVLIING